ncbi:MAG: MmcQ/YjbR family DNA-binding protein [Actinobacteria bacterium]|nr:MmcQ/YjbR family DNA-binding protein [Actinomycetota bacterium]
MVTWEQVRKLALELPEVEEATSWGSPSFKVRGKTFGGRSTRHGDAMWTRCDQDERPLLVESNPDLYRLTPHFERSPGYLLVWLEHAEEEDVRERLIDGWLIVAPKRLVAQFEVDVDSPG